MADTPIAPSEHLPGQGLSMMELVAHAAGEPISNAPQGASPVLTAWMLAWADQLDQEARDGLRTYVTRLATSRGSRELEARRRWLIADWLVRTATPEWLHAANLHAEAGGLEGLRQITQLADLTRCTGVMRAVAEAANDMQVAHWLALDRRERPRARVLVSAAITTASYAVTMVGPAARATGYADTPTTKVPLVWRRGTRAIQDCALAITWRSVAAVTARPRSSEALWQAAAGAARSALKVPEDHVRLKAHGLVEYLLAIGERRQAPRT